MIVALVSNILLLMESSVSFTSITFNTYIDRCYCEALREIALFLATGVFYNN